MGESYYLQEDFKVFPLLPHTPPSLTVRENSTLSVHHAGGSFKISYSPIAKLLRLKVLCLLEYFTKRSWSA